MARRIVSWCVIVTAVLIGAWGMAAEPVKQAAPNGKASSTKRSGQKQVPVKATPMKSAAPNKSASPPTNVPTPAPLKTAIKAAAPVAAPETPTPAPASEPKVSTNTVPTTTPAPAAPATAGPATTGAATVAPAPASDDATPAPGATFLLRYKFARGETLRWEVEHQAQVKMTVSGTTQTADTFSKSVKVWRVTQTDRQGRVTFIHAVDQVQMRQKLTGRQETTYDSQTDEKAPLGFQDVAKTVGKPLASITIDALGKLLTRDDLVDQPANAARQVTMPLPDEPVTIGYQWSVPDDLTVKGRDEQPKKIQRRQQYTLEDVKHGIATIRVETQVLTPVNDPSIEAQLVQGETSGKVRFDLQAGRIDSQAMGLDKHVVGVQGESSSMHYVTRFSERLLPANNATAAKPKVAGPELPPQ